MFTTKSFARFSILGLLCALAIAFPSLAGAFDFDKYFVIRPSSIHERIMAQLQSTFERACDTAGSPLLPSLCPPEEPPPPPPPTDVCPNVPGDQASGPCADVQCTEDGGTWNGTSCDMPPPPPTDVCPNVPGDQASGPCADEECVADGGTWNGSSCDMPPPPEEGNVIISEIMYDPPEADAGREWIEIRNETNAAVDLTDWKFFENATNHGLSLIAGDVVLPADSSAIIADNAALFALDWPDFVGTLFDSAFSLSNTGETIAIKNGAGEIVDEVTYSSAQGASNDGNSLQKVLENWVAALPTPGTPDLSPNSN